MKIRTGFVANSSSSSFILAIKSEKKPTLDEMMKMCGVLPGSVAEVLIKDMIKWLLDHTEDVTRKAVSVGLNTGELNGYYVGEDLVEWAKQMLDEGYSVYSGDVSNEDVSPVSNAIYDGFAWGHAGLDTPDLKIKVN